MTPEVTRWIFIAIAVIAVLVFWGIGAYNRLVGLRGAIVAAFAQIDEQMRRRQALLHALLEPLRADLPSEQGALDAVAAALQQVMAAAEAARAKVCMAVPIGQLSTHEGQLAAALTRLHALIEQHAQLRERDDIAPRAAELREIETRLGFARQLFNEASLQYNRAVHQFPTSMLISMFRFGEAGRL
jgi:LemA protein